MEVIKVTDEDMAEMLKKTLKEIKELKETNNREYDVLKRGVLCKKLGLDEDDLIQIYDKKVAI
jgi:hypothetical protein